MKTEFVLIAISILATMLTGYVDAINEAKYIWMKNNLPMYVADKFKDRYKKHSLWAVHRIVIFFTTSIAIWYIKQDWPSFCVAGVNFIAQMALFRGLHDGFLQIQFGNKFTTDADGLSDSKIDSHILDTFRNRMGFIFSGFAFIACEIIYLYCCSVK
jgi:hypothetical protein